MSLHYHVLAAEGVFLRPWYDLAARPTFLELPEPTADELAELLDQIIRRVTALLRRHGRLDDGAIDEEPEQLLLFAARSPVPHRGPPDDEELPPATTSAPGVNAAARSSNPVVDQRPPDADSLVGPDDPERARRLAWSELLRRVCNHDRLTSARGPRGPPPRGP